MKKKIIILSSLIFLFLVSLIVYTKAENKSTNNKKGILNWSIEIPGDHTYAYDFIEMDDGYILSSVGLITKYDKNGKLLWTQDNSNGAMEIIPDKDNGYITYGYGSRRYDNDYNDDSTKITKYDKDGKQIWQKENNNYVYDLLLVDDELIALSDKGLTKYGYNDDTVIWDTTNVNENENNVSGLKKVIETDDGYVAVGYNYDSNNKVYNGIIIKYNKQGNILWNKQYGSKKFYNIVNVDDGYIVSGDNVIVKYNKNGNIIWQGEVKCNNLVETDDGYIVVGDKIIVKYNKNGDILWENTWGDYRGLNQILVNGDKYIVGGEYNGIGTLFTYSKDGKLLDYHHIAGGNMIKFTANNDLSNYTVLTFGFFSNYSINTNNSDNDDIETDETYKIGDVVKYNGSIYYVIENSDSNQEYVTLLKAENLTRDEINKYKGDIQVTENSVPFYTSDNCYYNDENNFDEIGCSNNYKKSFVQKIIENWASDALNENDLATVGGYKVRSIKVDELINNLGYYFGRNEGTTWGSCLSVSLDTPSWVPTNIYWTMDGYEDGNDQVYSTDCVEKTYASLAIRPVINLKKTAIEKHSSNDNNLYCENGYDYEKQTKYKEFNIGDEVEHNGEKYYAIEDSDNKTKYITLLKDEPLTAEEVNKYNVGEYASKNGKIPYKNGCDSANFALCNSDYDVSDIKNVIDNWSNQFEDLIEVDGYKARLITIDEIINNMSIYPYQPTPSTMGYKVADNWMYNINYSYWTMSPYGDSDDKVYGVYSNGALNIAYETNNLFVKPVINLDKCAVDGGCYEEDVAIGCKDDKTVVNVPSTLKMVSKILLIISSILIIGGIGLITFNYIKARRERK